MLRKKILTLNEEILEKIELTIKAQIQMLSEGPVIIQRNEHTPKKVTDIRDYELGQFIGTMKVRQITYAEITLGRRLTLEENNEIYAIFVKYYDSIAYHFYN